MALQIVTESFSSLQADRPTADPHKGGGVSKEAVEDNVAEDAEVVQQTGPSRFYRSRYSKTLFL